MTKRIITLVIATLLLTMMIVPLTATALTWSAYVNTANGKGLNLRTGPSTESSILTSIPYGASVNITDYLDSGSWLRVLYKDYEGFVMTRYLTYEKPGPKPTSAPKPTSVPKPTSAPSGETIASIFNNFSQTSYMVQVRPSTPGGLVHFRWAPSKQAGIITDCHQGDILEVLAQNDSWAQVRNPDTGVTGFMMRSFLSSVGVGAAESGGKGS